jgi:hypothetical protein
MSERIRPAWFGGLLWKAHSSYEEATTRIICRSWFCSDGLENTFSLSEPVFFPKEFVALAVLASSQCDFWIF